MKDYLLQLFSFRGSINRQQYLEGMVCRWGFFGISFLSLCMRHLIYYPTNKVDYLFAALLIVLAVVFGMVAILLACSLDVKRFRDAGFSQWIIIVNLAPVVAYFIMPNLLDLAIVLSIILTIICFRSGTSFDIRDIRDI